MGCKEFKSLVILKITILAVIFSSLPFTSAGAIGSTHRAEVKRSILFEEPAEAIKFGFVAIGRQIIVDRLTDDSKLLKNGVKGDVERTFNLAIDECETIEYSQVINLSQPKRQKLLHFNLNGCRADNETILLSGILLEASFQLKNEEGKTFQKGKDFSIAEKGTLLKINPEGDAANETSLIARYKCWLSRIDTIVMDSNYRLTVLKGDGYKSAPEVRTNLDGKTPIANVLVVGGEENIDSENIWQIRRAGNKKLSDKLASCRASFSNLRKRLESGGKIKIAFLGDSVTGGSSARERKFAFPQLVEARLKSEFPNATIESATLAIGGGKCTDSIPLLPAFLNKHKPDVLFVEFVNDLASDLGSIATDYHQLIAICRELRIKVCLISPHYPVPLFANARTWPNIKNNAYFSYLRMLAVSQGVELVDVSSRWEHLNDEGLRPTVLLVNRLNHLNNTGHRIYAAELLKCFGIADGARGSIGISK